VGNDPTIGGPARVAARAGPFLAEHRHNTDSRCYKGGQSAALSARAHRYKVRVGTARKERALTHPTSDLTQAVVPSLFRREAGGADQLAPGVDLVLEEGGGVRKAARIGLIAERS